MSDNRDVGVEFGDLQDDLEAEEYPISAEELLDRYGDRRVEHANGSTSVRELLETAAKETYESPEAVHQVVLNMVGDEAGGRKDYTDRGSNAGGEDFEQQSF